MAPFSPDDDRFYQSLAQGGQDYQKYRDRVAEDQAAHAREMGELYGQMPLKAVQAGMQGADWRMNRAKNQQQMQLAEEQAGRQQAAEGREAEKYSYEQPQLKGKMEDFQKKQAFDAAPAEESYAALAKIPYQPGMTHHDVDQLADARALANKTTEFEQAAKREQDEQNYRNNQLALERKKLDIDNNKKDLPKPAPAELIGKLGEADAAEQSLASLAKEWQEKASKPGSGIKSLLPGTDASRYEDAANLNAQTIGKFLEEGKMTDADVPRYKAMLPTAYDTPTRAQEKLERLSASIARKKKAHVDALTAAGYATGMPSSGEGLKFSFKTPPPTGTAVAAPSAGPDANDRAALIWLQDPKNAAHPAAAGVRAKLRAKGLLGDDQAFGPASAPYPVAGVN